MSTVVIGCDINTGKDHDWQNTVAKVLEKNGHTTEKLQIAPNPFAAYSYNTKAKGKIGVYIIADGLFSIGDLYYGNTYFKYAYFLIRGDLGHSRMDSEEDFKNNPIAADADTRGEAAKLAGKTFPQMNKITKSKCLTVWGGKTPEEGAKNLIKAMGGDVSSDDEGSAASSTIKDALKKAVSGWDGDIEIRLIEDTVYVNKIHDPTETKLVIAEYDNVQYDSLSVTDINPQTVNKLILNYQGRELTLTDDTLIERFGEIPFTIEADETVESYNDALSFLQRNWGKIRREDGRQVELKVEGDTKWKTGLWVRVYLPRFHIDDYMYITRMSADEDGGSNWTTSLTLVDYPPSFGVEVEEPEEEEEEETDEDAESTEEE